jgi:hypothetical protein
MTGAEESRIAWRKSSASNTRDCVQVAVGGGEVLVRDSANRDGAVLRFPPAAWSAFMARTRAISGSGTGQWPPHVII